MSTPSWPPKRTAEDTREISANAQKQLTDWAIRQMEQQHESKPPQPEPEPQPEPVVDPTYTADAQKAAYEELLKFFNDTRDDAHITSIDAETFVAPPKQETTND